jgi:hypothetical protein
VSVSVRDSVGVEIVESFRPAWSGLQAWVIDSVPSVEIGVEAGEEAYQLNGVYDADRLADGTILVGNSGSGEIRVFDARGRFLRAIGRTGRGPGEFSGPIHLYPASDGSLVAFDVDDLRVHHFDSSGMYRRTVRIQWTTDGLRAFFADLFGDGSWLAIAAPPSLRNEPGTYLRSAQQYLRFGADGRPLTLLRRVEGRMRFVHRLGELTHYPFVPFTAEPQARAHGDRVYIVPSGSPEIEVRDLSGTLRRVIRLGLQLDLTADVYARYREVSLAKMAPERRRRYAPFYSLSHPLPEHMPAFQGLIVDGETNLWLERYRLPWDEDWRYEVVDGQGRWLGQVRAPERLRIYQVGADFVLGRQLDSLGVERVQLHPLRRGSHP